jgi:hypothetical protein
MGRNPKEFTAKSAKHPKKEGGWNHDAMSRVQTWNFAIFAFFAVNPLFPIRRQIFPNPI